MKKPLLLTIATMTLSTGVLAHTLPATNITNQCACTLDMSNRTYICKPTTEHATDVVFASGVSSEGLGHCTFNNSDAFAPGATADVSDVDCDSNQPIFEVIVPNSNSDDAAYISYQTLDSPTSLVVVQVHFDFEGGYEVPAPFNSTWIDTSTCAYTGPTF